LIVFVFRDYKNDEPVLYLRFLRRLTAPKGYKALKKFQAAFTSYYDAGHVSQSSPVIQERYASYRKHWENPSIAAVEVMILQAAVMNFTSSVFWMLNFIFSDSELLKDVRGELEGICTVITTEPIIEASHSDEPQAKPKVATIDTNTLLASCPLIVSLLAASRATLRDDNFIVADPAPANSTLMNLIDHGVLSPSFIALVGLSRPDA